LNVTGVVDPGVGVTVTVPSVFTTTVPPTTGIGVDGCPGVGKTTGVPLMLVIFDPVGTVSLVSGL
jgi:hypothetical protein